MIISGGLAGLGGAFLSIVANPFYLEGQVSGRGYIGLAAMIFGNWMPGGLAIGAGLFGYTDSLNLRGGSTNVHALLLLGALLLLAGAIWLAIRKKYVHAVITLVVGALVFAWYAGTNEVPNQVVAATPYVITLVVLALKPAKAHAEGGRTPVPEGTGRMTPARPPRRTPTGRRCARWHGRPCPTRTPPTRATRSVSPPWSTTGAPSAAARENASYGLGLCAECGLVSELQRTGGGRLTHFTCVDGTGAILVPCGRCRRAAVRVRRPRTAPRNPVGRPAAVGDAAPGLRPGAPRRVTP
ncbi:hypothetical protein SHIRM173S_08399 [Streptomyces hirsutus]